MKVNVTYLDFALATDTGIKDESFGIRMFPENRT